LLARADVRDAYSQMPLSGMEKALSELRRKENVEIENESYGTPSTSSIEAALAKNRCPDVKLGPYIDLIGALDAQRAASLRSSGAFDGADPLIFQSAGNDGVEIDSPADSADCEPNRVNHPLVGSYDIYRGQAARSVFSNYGDCVDLYAPGEALVLPVANGFYAPVFGTSFSAPLAARYASTLFQQSSDASSLLARVLDARDANRFLPVSIMPAELEAFDTSRITALASISPGSGLEMAYSHASGVLMRKIGGAENL
jgi:hypothetical protein